MAFTRGPASSRGALVWAGMPARELHSHSCAAGSCLCLCRETTKSQPLGSPVLAALGSVQLRATGVHSAGSCVVTRLLKEDIQR